jgi:hypothetical protein
MRRQSCLGLLAGAATLALLHAAPASADPSPSTSTVPPAPANKPTVSPRLQVTPPANVLPENLHNPTTAEAPTKIHQRDWGVFNRDGGSPAGFGPVARYGIDRSQEDWSFLTNPSLSDDLFDPLKFIPLSQDKSVYLTLSGDERLKNWYETRPFLGAQKPYDSGRFTARTLFGADLHLGPFFRVYGELVNGDAAGWAGYGYNQTYRKTLDIQQLYAEVKVPVGTANLGATFGRQEFFDAPNYVLFGRETPDVPLSWNGVRGYVFWPRVRLDVFDFVQTNTNPTQVFADTESYKTRLFGAYESWAVPDFSFLGRPGHVFLDFFYLGYDYSGSSAALATTSKSASGATHRDNVGTRLWGKAGPVEFSLGGLYQGGSFTYAKTTRSRPVDAYAVNTVVGYRLPQRFGNALLALQSDLYSGGNDADKKGDVGTYAAPFNPQTAYLDTTTYLAPGNLIDTGPTLEVTPSSTTFLRLRVPFYWRDSVEDDIYGSSRIYTFKGRYSGGYVATIPQASFAWRITRHFTWTQDVARVLASQALAAAGGKDGTYYLSTLDYRF